MCIMYNRPVLRIFCDHGRCLLYMLAPTAGAALSLPSITLYHSIWSVFQSSLPFLHSVPLNSIRKLSLLHLSLALSFITSHLLHRFFIIICISQIAVFTSLTSSQLCPEPCRSLQCQTSLCFPSHYFPHSVLTPPCNLQEPPVANIFVCFHLSISSLCSDSALPPAGEPGCWTRPGFLLPRPLASAPKKAGGCRSSA